MFCEGREKRLLSVGEVSEALGVAGGDDLPAGR